MAAVELAKAYVQIIPSTKGIKEKLKEELGDDVAGAGDSAGKTAGESFGKSLCSKIKNIIIAAGIGETLKKTIEEGAHLEQSIGGIETLFGAGGAKSVEEYASSVGKSVDEITDKYSVLKEAQDTMLKNASVAYKTAGLSASDYMDTVTGFAASLKQSTGDDMEQLTTVANQAVIDMADNANKMGTNMQDIQNAYQGFAKQNYTMLDNLKLGYGGTKTEMERLLKDATAISGVEYNLDNLADVYSAIHVIQNELGITGTTSKEAASTLSGSLASMKAAATNVLANLALGEDIRPSLNGLLDSVGTFLNNNLIPMVGNIIQGLPEVINGLISMLIGELNIASKNSEEFVQFAIDIISDIAMGLIQGLPYLLEGAWNLITSLLAALIEYDWLGFANNVISEISNNMSIASGEIFGSDDGNIIVVFLQTITDRLPDVLNKGVEILSTIVNGILEKLPYLLEGAGQIIGTLINFITDNLPTVLNAGADLLLNIVSGIIQNLPQIAESGIKLILSLLSSLLEALPKIISAGAEMTTKLAFGFVGAFPQLVGKIPELVRDIINCFTSFDWGELGRNIIDGIKEGILGMAGTLVQSARDVAGKALDGMKSFLGIHSPSKVFENQVGKMIDLGVAGGVDNNANVVEAAMQDLSNTAVTAYDTEIGFTGTVRSQSKDTDTRIIELLNEYLPQLIKRQNVMDTGEVVGALAQPINEELGKIALRGGLA